MKTFEGKIKINGKNTLNNTSNYSIIYDNIIGFDFLNESYKTKNKNIKIVFGDGSYETINFNKNNKMLSGRELLLINKQTVKINVLLMGDKYYIHDVINIENDDDFISSMPKTKYGIMDYKHLLALQKLQILFGLKDSTAKKLVNKIHNAGFDKLKNEVTFKLLIKGNEEHLNDLLKNPYRLLQVKGIGIETTNRIADFLRIPKTDKMRVYYNMIYNEKGTMISKKILSEINPDVKDKMIGEGMILNTGEIIERVNEEIELSEIINSITNQRRAPMTKSTRSTLNKKQVRALNKALKYNFLLITGEGGTGKTYTVCKIIDELKLNDKSVIITSTSHKSLLKYRMKYVNCNVPDNEDSFSEGHNKEENDFELVPDGDIDIAVAAKINIKKGTYKKADTLIIDEVSMFGVTDLVNTLRNVEFNSLIIIGDPNQLPSISYGNTLGDIFNSVDGKYAVKLTEQKRTNNKISKKIKKMLRDKTHKCLKKQKNKILNTITKLGMESTNPKAILNVVTKYYKMMENKYGRENTFVISYKNDSVHLINNYISESIHEDWLSHQSNEKGATEESINIKINDNVFQNIQFGIKMEYCVGDRVKIIENGIKDADGEDKIQPYYNNQFGILTSFEEKNGNTFVSVTSEGRTIDDIPADHITHGWAATCHSFQGSESTGIIVYCDTVSDVKWLYTALSRGKSSVIVIYTDLKTSSSDTLSCSLSRSEKRLTTLKDKIQNKDTNYINVSSNKKDYTKQENESEEDDKDNLVIKNEDNERKIIVRKRKRYTPAEREKTFIKYFGNVAKAKCPNCDYYTISIGRFHMGHIEAHAKGGSGELDNIVPLCSPCNQSIGTDKVNMDNIDKNIKKYRDECDEDITLQSMESEFSKLRKKGKSKRKKSH